MIAEHATRSNWSLAAAFVLWFGGTWFGLANLESQPTSRVVAWTMEAAFTVAVILAALGCSYYAAAKGYRLIWGALALFSIVGLLVLIFLRDLHPSDDDSLAYRVRPDDSPRPGDG